jgi:hypothetical protein
MDVRWWRGGVVSKRTPVQHDRIRWCNPKLGDFEWREVPHSDEEGLSLPRAFMERLTDALCYAA